jgi:hypothetical protein
MQHTSLPDLEELSEALTTAATLGTDRRTLQLPPTSGPLGTALAQLDPARGAEWVLLGAAAALTSYQQAGLRAAPVRMPIIEAAAPDTLPVCAPRAAQHLQVMLSGDQRAALPEWLMLLAMARQRIPALLLPDLFELGKGMRELQPLIAVVAGTTGKWLAQQNPEWQYVITGHTATTEMPIEQAQAIWEVGTRSERLAVLTQLRQTDPAAAHALIAAAFPREKADERAAMLEKCSIGLSMADEPWLETLLDDRSKEVRSTAIALLMRLPESRFVARMVARVAPLLRWSPPQGRRILGLVGGKPGVIEVSLPESCDKPMQRDGVDPKDIAIPGLGERAQWLYQMLCSIPPSYWSNQWQANPADLLAAAQASEWNTLLVQAWDQGTQRVTDAAWAEVLLRLNLTNGRLLAFLTPERQESVLIDLLANFRGPIERGSVFELLTHTQHYWSAELSRAVLTTLARHMRARSSGLNYQFHPVLITIATRVPTTLPALDETLASMQHDALKIDAYWKTLFENALGLVQFRREMQAALRM